MADPRGPTGPDPVTVARRGLDAGGGGGAGGGPSTVLVLGGTADARELAGLLDARPDLRPITSLAGRVADPAALPGEVRVGGFGGPAELASWITSEGVRAVVDATHPFAARISANAAVATSAAGVPLVALRRPGWAAGPGDDWHDAVDLADAASRVAGLGRRVLLAIGRQEVGAFAAVDDAWFLVRAIEAPDGPLPPHHELLLDRGPYALEGERDLLAEHGIDLVVTKDSGGDATRAKLDAARERGIPVLVVRRPAAPGGPGTVVVDTAAAAAEAVAQILAG
ncbi:cobalt-precorrin-6A reductase [Patulibacter sp.]|uniref:cobalt-precorrin-6A reductase n=1 Tax=Patulibacter sp. TaxID=1912859 RepID=UPI00271E4208|nr:cobalt-precorrin-6A reductase [Patulibacter sp.]MDO9407103.1 cobalt-precorrin-6A reductase [Patulibacter sp.]